MNSKRDNFIGSIMLTLCAMIWGSAFVAQSAASEYVGALTFTCLRNVFGFAALVPLAAVTARKNKVVYGSALAKADKKTLLLGGSFCGAALCIASYLQQLGIDMGTQPGKAGFITSLYVLLVPVFGLLLKKKTRPIIWPCIALFLFGLYLLCVKESSVVRSDIYVLLCAVCFAVQIIAVDSVSKKVDGVFLSMTQFFVCCVLTAVPAVLFEEINAELIKQAFWSIAFTGVMSSGVAYTLQIYGQQRTEPAIASMLMSLESLFATAAGMLFYRQIPTAQEARGCVLMLAAVMVAQMPQKRLSARGKSADAKGREG